MLCPRCLATLPATASPAWPSPVPEGLVPPWAAGAYDGVLRELVVGHKDHGRWGHRRLLGRLLAVSVAGAVAVLPGKEALLLVPVPSRPGVARRRGYEPTAALTRECARRLARERAGEVRAVALLRSRGGVGDQVGLGATARAANVAGSMWCPTPALAGLARGVRAAHLVICDDILTTGSTAREAQRALAAVGLPPVAVATVAATARTHG